ncbi:hypothetical protein SKAU_G00124190 [Synaphobranchus kaupii]|uniref:Secreted protein n=1 Tax=Synaphobranchus kaupii TaxID=118154 RepID=A0A9Q1J2Q5_SYNKA|nr:hypothetical protein SKAU_G00124190 [Synaphobranchus kaupii]
MTTVIVCIHTILFVCALLQMESVQLWLDLSGCCMRNYIMPCLQFALPACCFRIAACRPFVGSSSEWLQLNRLRMLHSLDAYRLAKETALTLITAHGLT